MMETACAELTALVEAGRADHSSNMYLVADIRATKGAAISGSKDQPLAEQGWSCYGIHWAWTGKDCLLASKFSLGD